MKKVEINLDEIRANRRLFVATPAYGGGMHCSYVTSLLGLTQTFNQYNLPLAMQFMFNESLISRARNKLVDMFLATDCTDLLFIDADIEFNPQDVLLMLHENKDVIGGAYPLKSLNWDNIKRAILKNPDISVEDLKYQGANWSTHPFNGTVELGFDPIEVKELATGFLMIKREVFEKMAEHMPTYAPASNEPELRGRVTDFFYVGVDPHEDRYVSEDYSFCCKWRELGGKILLCPWIKLTHHGSFGFPGNMISVANGLGEIH